MIIVLGSINADLLFKVEKLPRPGETVLCSGYAFAPGGKGANQAAAAAKAGAEVRFAGQVGGDSCGTALRQGLEAAGVVCDLLRISERPTGVAVIGIDEAGENAIIVGSGANLDTRVEQVPDDLLRPGTTVLCQNEIRREETFAVLCRAHARGARTVLNMAPAGTVPDDVLAALDVLVLNQHEAATLAGTAGAAPADLAHGLATRHDLVCVVTLGAEGALAVSREAAWQVPVLPVQPVDTTGAGDAFVGVLTAWLDQGAELREALRAAAVGAALTCESLGAQTAQPSREAITARLRDMSPAKTMRHLQRSSDGD